MRQSTLYLFALLMVLSLVGCSALADPGVCTAEFVTYELTVLTPEGQPADSVQVTVYNKASGREYEVCSAISLCEQRNAGEYVIFHDGFKSEISEDGEPVIVVGQKGNLHFRTEHIFRNDECHVQKVSGPEVVTLVQS